MNTLIFVWSALIAIAFLFGVLRKKDIKSEIVSLGVLGTFVGILLSLQHFDVTNIKDALPQILEGMKLAFVTSVEGMAASILLSGYLKSKPEPSQLQTLISLQQEAVESQKRIAELMEESVTSKTDEFIEALDSIVKQFNAEMLEQFGENFSKLDKTVERFLEQQKDYQHRLEKLHENMESLSKKHEQINNTYSKLSENTSTITNEMQKGVDIIQESLSLALRRANGTF